MTFTKWHHSPAHLFLPNAFCFITGATLNKMHFFRPDDRLDLLQQSLFDAMTHYSWEPEAWAIFSNHYHLIAKAPNNPKSLVPMLKRVHSQTARELNKLDATPGRQVWFQYRDKCLSYEKSYCSRLNYVMQNPVRHGLVGNAEMYPWCSAAWFRANAEPGFFRKIRTFAFDKLEIDDDF
jgi:putative transposase